jgi:hypothetical protein
MKILVKLCVIYAVIFGLADGFTYQRTFRQTEICGFHNGHRKYLEEGESGTLLAHNITVPSVRKLD